MTRFMVALVGLGMVALGVGWLVPSWAGLAHRLILGYAIMLAFAALLGLWLRRLPD